jgi:biopolymer transport protein ExbB/TolQ
MKAVYLFSGSLFVFGLILIISFTLAHVDKMQSDNKTLKWQTSGMQRRIDELENLLGKMTDDAAHFHNELEACQRERSPH